MKPIYKYISLLIAVVSEVNSQASRCRRFRSLVLVPLKSIRLLNSKRKDKERHSVRLNRKTFLVAINVILFWFWFENENQKTISTPKTDSDYHNYNSKYMNSVWGLYNRYAPQAFQKNLEVGLGSNNMTAASKAK